MGVYQSAVNGNTLGLKRPHAWLSLKAAWEKKTLGHTWIKTAAEDGVKIAFKDLNGNRK